jgi:hypothetical protein
MMSEYLNIKIPEEKIKNLKKALRKKGIDPRGNAEAINIVIDNFILQANLENTSNSQNQEESIKT